MTHPYSKRTPLHKGHISILMKNTHLFIRDTHLFIRDTSLFTKDTYLFIQDTSPSS
jgi:hypothetical protein